MSRQHKIIRRFTSEEDERLKSLVHQYGESNWIRVSNKMPGRNSRQCKDRYLQYLSPEANRTPWTYEEEVLLEKLVAQFGTQWTRIALYFKGRPDSQIKNKWKTFQNRNKKRVMKEKYYKEYEQTLKKRETKQSMMKENSPTEEAEDRNPFDVFEFDLEADFLFDDYVSM